MNPLADTRRVVYRRDPPWLDVGAVITRTMEVIGERPVPLFAASVVAYLPNMLLSLALVGGMFAFLGDPQQWATQPERVFERAREAFSSPAFLLAALGGFAVFLFLTAVVAAFSEATTLIGFRERYLGNELEFGRLLSDGLKKVPTLLLVRILNMLLLFGLYVGGAVAVIVPAALLSDASGLAAALWAVVFGLAWITAALLVFGIAALATSASVFEGLGAFASLSRAVEVTRGVRGYVFLTWLVSGIGLFAMCCVGSCFSSCFTMPVQLVGGPVLGQLASSVVQSLMYGIFGVGLHGIGAVMFAEMIGFGRKQTGEELADVFR